MQVQERASGMVLAQEPELEPELALRMQTCPRY